MRHMKPSGRPASLALRCLVALLALGGALPAATPSADPTLDPAFTQFVFEEPSSHDGALLQFDIAKACAHALACNRGLQAGGEAVMRSELSLGYECSEYDLKYSPTGQLGFIGGGSAGTGPTIGGGIDISKKFSSGTKVSLSPYILQANKKFNSTLRAYISQPLLKGLGPTFTTARVQAAQYALRSAQRTYYGQRLKVIQRVIATMYDIVRQEEYVRVADESLRRLQGYYEAAKIKDQLGLGDGLDIYRAETALRSAEEQLLAAQERHQEAMDVFRELLSLPMDQPLRIVVPMVYHNIDLEADEAIDIALQRRIEVEQAMDTIGEQKRILKWSLFNMLPELNMVINYSNWGIDQVFTRSLNKKRESTWGIGFTTNSDMAQNSERLFYDNSQVGLEAAYRNLEQTEVQVTLEVKRALRGLRQAGKRIVLQEEQIETAERQLRLAKAKFDCNMASNFDVLQAERNLMTAQTSYFAAVVEHITGEIALMLAMGQLADKPLIMGEEPCHRP